MKRGNISRWPVHFLRYVHNFYEILIDKEVNDGYTQYSLHKCSDCSVVALQDKGSLGYYIIDENSDYNEITCDEAQIKDIIE